MLALRALLTSGAAAPSAALCRFPAIAAAAPALAKLGGLLQSTAVPAGSVYAPFSTSSVSMAGCRSAGKRSVGPALPWAPPSHTQHLHSPTAQFAARAAAVHPGPANATAASADAAVSLLKSLPTPSAFAPSTAVEATRG